MEDIRESLRTYIELYKRGEYEYIPICSYKDPEQSTPENPVFVDGYMTKKQLRAIRLINDKETDYIGYGGSARSGKTVLEAFAALFDCMAYPGIAWGLGRKELTTLTKTVLVTLNEVMKFYGIEKDKHYRHDKVYNFIEFTNGSRIYLIDMAFKPTDPLFLRFGGYELTRAAVDESNECVELGVKTLFARTGWKKNIDYDLNQCVLETFNPDKSHVYSRYYRPYRDQNETHNKKFIPALPSDNPHPAVKIWIKKLVEDPDSDTVLIQRLVHGNFDYDDDPSRLCDYDAICDMFTNTHVAPGNSYISADLAMQGRDRFIAGKWNGFICNISIDKKKATGRSIELDLKDLKNRTATPNSRIVADSGGLGEYLESYINNIRTFHGQSSAVNKKEYYSIKDECAFYLARLINKREIQIICTKAQQERIKYEISACLKRDNIDIDKKKIIKKDIMKELIGCSPDYLDMLIMRMVFEIKRSYRGTSGAKWNNQ